MPEATDWDGSAERRTVIFANGLVTDLAAARAALGPSDRLIAATERYVTRPVSRKTTVGLGFDLRSCYGDLAT